MELRDHDFLELVKRTRQKFGVGIDEAHQLIFAGPTLRRLAALRINRDPKCRAIANASIRRLGEKSLFVREGERLRFR
ncbi:MAG: hypothetical protein GXC70_01235 [Sphingomonadaceae bacterium]|nr:hypothetical protein [Sphingomonadaceae bacterium]